MNIFRHPTISEILTRQLRELEISLVQAELDRAQAQARVTMMTAQLEVVRQALARQP